LDRGPQVHLRLGTGLYSPPSGGEKRQGRKTKQKWPRSNFCDALLLRAGGLPLGHPLLDQINSKGSRFEKPQAGEIKGPLFYSVTNFPARAGAGHQNPSGARGPFLRRFNCPRAAGQKKLLAGDLLASQVFRPKASRPCPPFEWGKKTGLWLCLKAPTVKKNTSPDNPKKRKRKPKRGNPYGGGTGTEKRATFSDPPQKKSFFLSSGNRRGRAILAQKGALPGISFTFWPRV